MSPLKPFQIALLEFSFRKINRNAEQATMLFYTRLFELSPGLRDLAKNDFAQQKRELIKLLGTIVHRLDGFDEIREHVRELANQHAEIIENEHHLLAVGAALFWMLEQVLGRDFTPDCYGAWMAVYGLLSNELKTAARDLALAC